MRSSTNDIDNELQEIMQILKEAQLDLDEIENIKAGIRDIAASKCSSKSSTFDEKTAVDEKMVYCNSLSCINYFILGNSSFEEEGNDEEKEATVSHVKNNDDRTRQQNATNIVGSTISCDSTDDETCQEQIPLDSSAFPSASYCTNADISESYDVSPSVLYESLGIYDFSFSMDDIMTTASNTSNQTRDKFIESKENVSSIANKSTKSPCGKSYPVVVSSPKFNSGSPNTAKGKCVVSISRKSKGNFNPEKTQRSGVNMLKQDKIDHVVLKPIETDPNTRMYPDKNRVIATNHHVNTFTNNSCLLKDDMPLPNSKGCNGSNFKAVDYDLEPVLLYRAIDMKQWELAFALLKANPEEAKTWVFRRNDMGQILWKFLPIHASCFSGAPKELVQALIHVCPEAVRVQAVGGKLPIHIAIETGAHHDIVISLLEEFPDSLCTADSNGFTPSQLYKNGSSKNKSHVMKVLSRPTSAIGRMKANKKLGIFKVNKKRDENRLV